VKQSLLILFGNNASILSLDPFAISAANPVAFVSLSIRVNVDKGSGGEKKRIAVN
jgi:hypothetical protein